MTATRERTAGRAVVHGRAAEQKAIRGLLRCSPTSPAPSSSPVEPPPSRTHTAAAANEPAQPPSEQPSSGCGGLPAGEVLLVGNSLTHVTASTRPTSLCR